MKHKDIHLASGVGHGNHTDTIVNLLNPFIGLLSFDFLVGIPNFSSQMKKAFFVKLIVVPFV